MRSMAIVTAAAIVAIFAGALAEPASAAAAKRCRVGRTPFDQSTGFHIRMGVSNEGGACEATTRYKRVGKNGETDVLPSSGSIGTPPQHGTARLVFSADNAVVEYTPTAGYVGPDRIEMRLIPSPFPWTVEINVGP